MKFKYIFIAIIAIASLAFLYYAISPLFITTRLDEALPNNEVVQEGFPEELGRADSAMTPDTKIKEPMPDSSVATEPVDIKGTTAHPAYGTVRIVKADDKIYLRYEDFKTINGPDIFVYLSKDLETSEFVDLGVLKATEGDLNYEIPEGIDPRDYPYALVWWKQFGVPFNSAKLY